MAIRRCACESSNRDSVLSPVLRWQQATDGTWVGSCGCGSPSLWLHEEVYKHMFEARLRHIHPQQVYREHVARRSAHATV